MEEIIGVRFRQAGKIYYFNPEHVEYKCGDHVIVETVRGTEYGTVVIENREEHICENLKPLKTVIRKTDKKDEEQNKANKESEKEAFDICIEKIKKHKLQMKLIDAEYTFDRGKILFYFTADERVDFRALVKDLAAVFRTRIELRQVGVRDETKILGGFGICGRPLCCHAFLSEFQPVSIKMAKEQGLSLNPSNISGICGRLMCCLKNEEDVYEYLNSKLPSIGDTVTSKDGYKGEVMSVSVLKQNVKIRIKLENDEVDLREYHVDDLKFKKKKQYRKDRNENNREIKELERLEKKDPKNRLEN